MAKIRDPVARAEITIIYLLGCMQQFHGVYTAADQDVFTQSHCKHCFAL